MTSWRPRLARRSGRNSHARLDPPLYARIVDALAADIAEGRLVPGSRLPTQRELAEAVGATVATVTRSYAEARRRGLVDATVGRGTFVRDAVYAPATRGPADLTVNSIAPAPFIGEMLASFGACVDAAAGDALVAYQPHQGATRHRETGAAWLRERRVPTDPDEVVVTAGAQHAMLVALATLTRPRDVVLVERLTYPGVKSLANHLHLRLEPVEIDDEGLMPESLADTAARTKARVVYLMPTLQNPTTATMGPARRRAIAAVIDEHGLTAIEDDQYGFLADETPLAALVPDRVMYINSVSKSLAAGLRVGFLRAPATLIPRLGAAVFASAVMAPSMTAELTARWIGDGLARRIVEWKREELTARQQIARRVLGWRAPRPARRTSGCRCRRRPPPRISSNRRVYAACWSAPAPPSASARATRARGPSLSRSARNPRSARRRPPPPRRRPQGSPRVPTPRWCERASSAVANART